MAQLDAFVLSGKNTSTIPLTVEEEDLRARSSKKIKNGVEQAAVMSGHWPKLGEKAPKAIKGGPSFADKLKGIHQSDEQALAMGEERGGDNDSDDSMSDDDEPPCKTIEDPNRNFPTFVFSSKMKKRMYKVWRDSLIIKLLGRNIGFKALESRVQSFWAKRGVTKLINIGHGYFVVKFSNKEDYMLALTGAPWMIYDHYLIVRPWEPQFNSGKAKVDKAAVWIRLPRIFLEYYDKEALSFIGDRIGETVKVDINTSCQLRGHYARLCVVVDLSKRLMSGFTLDGENYYIEYKGLHMLCTECGIYGHRQESCPEKNKKNKEQSAMALQITHHGGSSSSEQERVVKDGKSGECWKVVQKHRRPRKDTPAKSKEKQVDGVKDTSTGSRFALLADEEVGGSKAQVYLNHEASQ
ncbi:hypothetical protein QN277_021145 [Acacia crassicarpa]|uniref:CCHC-type domain-containing protein n=1 Tax=Acacia crassicarpa TaxID=499986 RepID=A0AAE1JLA9_9FABA|nr:hypothetical protein QN277_021145 [Acacia crassicarpa]